MNARKHRDLAAWRDTLDGRAKYEVARRAAQAKADAIGFDYGIQPNDASQEWWTFLLPRRENRFGFELRCEVVSPSGLANTWPGHGWGGQGTRKASGR